MVTPLFACTAERSGVVLTHMKDRTKYYLVNGIWALMIASVSLLSIFWLCAMLGFWNGLAISVGVSVASTLLIGLAANRLFGRRGDR